MIKRFITTMSKKAATTTKTPDFLLKTPKGTKDWADKDMIIRESIFEKLTTNFKKHGGVTIDTPVFELREILTGKYGEDSKLIYNLEDQGGELTSLRYDLTVPFARFVASNNISNIKRYHIAKVYRRDQPAMTKGRMREFYQCDFDIAGTYDLMIPDSEILNILIQGLNDLKIENFKVKLNHRKILDGIFEACGVPEEDIRKVSSAIDKLDKSPWEVVKKEILEKGQSEEIADKIWTFVQHNGSIREVIEILKNSDLQNETAKQGLHEMEVLADYVEAFEIQNYLKFDLSLARGLDYYTGLIYEAVTEASAPPKNLKEKPKDLAADDDASAYVGVGSIAAGGRYDNLVGMFSNNKSIPCVGISFGVERLFSIIKQKTDLTKINSQHTDVYVMAFGNGFLKERMSISNKLWKNGINCEFLYKEKGNLRKQFEGAEKSGAKLAVILGKEEFPQGKLKIKMLGQDNNEEETIEIDDLVKIVESKLNL
ncbi:HTS1 [Candida jiufengensis]|uniref:HTS1 n=1 Tax=Candida jiufengensis TaxID=497108 RepID=UPI00222497E9|nr:HTS1 [Candida jiufengensis]KAI5956156.1 HTS1 [Candida jiufengensis]